MKSAEKAFPHQPIEDVAQCQNKALKFCCVKYNTNFIICMTTGKNEDLLYFNRRKVDIFIISHNYSFYLYDIFILDNVPYFNMHTT